MALAGRVVRPLSERATATASFASRHGWPVDVAIGGVRFLLNPSAETPYVRRTAPIRKDQFDAEAEPGEQSLTGWWLRSQQSFHQGAGVIVQESIGSADPSNRFRDSLGVDVWTPGQMKLLKDVTSLGSASSTVRAVGATDGTTPVVFSWEGAVLSRRVSEVSSATVTWGGSGSLVDVALSPTDYYAANATSIFKGTLAGGTGTAVWNTGNASVKLGWVKQRLVAGIGPSVYELITGGPTLPTPLYTHPSSSWLWTAVVEGPAAIYAAGYAGGSSSILAFTLDSTGAMPTLTSAVTVADLPMGEVVHSLFPYLGSFLVIGTNKGVRVATISGDGSVSYGPLTVELPAGAGPVKSLVGRDRYVWATATNAMPDGNSGLYRIDLSADQDGRFPWATDLQGGATGVVGSVFLLGDRIGFTLDSVGLKVEHATRLVASGYLRTGRIRFRTLEPKLFKYVRLRTDALAGAIQVEAITDTDNTATVVTLTTQGESDHEDAALPQSLGPQESIALKLTLSRASVDPSAGPVVRSYQVKALPGSKRQRIIGVPLLCFDREQHPSGQRIGYQGYARERLEALEAIEDAGDAVLFQDFTSIDRQWARLVVIDEIEYRQTFPPTPERDFGGVLYLTLRAID